ncbi:bacillithiol system redox-active protein YtxJ [Cecembia lonarensis]|uniref:Bacillithiol system protein YtxJ n=1 Tax=Cecembia lonarensis (strain CCUG 58316 / KCTC 22772 / LW9) TaxID=1225176 RepID=K1L6G3_CECL9|nr:bacillithiol system redox-active protein YtxJ [Cecembia lonarensis]EKB50291.1 bacillithiol system protein YtxJ [Cecembia lonarensis LW9]
MDWIKLEDKSQIEAIKIQSKAKPVLIFKHSTRCSISSMVLERLKRNWKSEDFEKTTPYILDLIANRDLSNQIAQEFGVFHQSPQIILIKDEKSFYDTSHMGINYPDIMRRI